MEAMGYKFDADDRGIMTFVGGEILDLGLEEKNRALLGWTQVGVVRPRFDDEPAIPEDETRTAFNTPGNRDAAQLIPSL